jgi:hypothetical protein
MEAGIAMSGGASLLAEDVPARSWLRRRRANAVPTVPLFWSSSALAWARLSRASSFVSNNGAEAASLLRCTGMATNPCMSGEKVA